MRLQWQRGPLGWAAFRKTGPRTAIRYTIRSYRAGDGSLCYVLRVDGSASTSPAAAYRTLAAAKMAGEKLPIGGEIIC